MKTIKTHIPPEFIFVMSTLTKKKKKMRNEVLRNGWNNNYIVCIEKVWWSLRFYIFFEDLIIKVLILKLFLFFSFLNNVKKQVSPMFRFCCCWWWLWWWWCERNIIQKIYNSVFIFVLVKLEYLIFNKGRKKEHNS